MDTTDGVAQRIASVAEGGSITYTATLTSAAQTPVTVTLDNGAVITIAAGASSGSASVPAPSEDVSRRCRQRVAHDRQRPRAATSKTWRSIPQSATTTITDTIDTTTVSLTASPSVAEGGAITYTATLTSAAQSAVTVTLDNGATITIAAGASSGSVERWPRRATTSTPTPAR